MNSNYFSSGSKTSQIRVKREKPKKKQVNWDRTVYLLVLILVVTLITRALLTRTYFVSGEGQVISEVVDIRSPDDVDIRMIKVKPGDIVEPGDTLFSFSFIDWQERQSEIDLLNQRIADLRFELADAKESAFLKNEEIRSLENRIVYLEKEKEVFQERVRLNISTVFELNDLNRDLFDARSNLELTISEERVLRNLIERMDERLDLFMENYLKIARNVETRYFTSQLGGRVDNVYKKGNSQAFRSEEILTLIPEQSEVFVLSVFNRKDTRYLNTGSVMDIEFDNGDRSRGIISQSYEARDDLLRHFRQTGTITSDYLIVELEPSDENTRDIWRLKNRSGLQITKPRYFNFMDTIFSGFGTAAANRSVQPEFPEPDGVERNSEQSEEAKRDRERDKTEFKTALMDTPVWSESEGNPPPAQVPFATEMGGEQAGGETEGDRVIMGYSINLYSFDDPGQAQHAVKKIAGGRASFICEIQSDEGDMFWRVSTGEFITVDEAMEVAGQLFDSTGQDYFISRLSDQKCERN